MFDFLKPNLDKLAGDVEREGAAKRRVMAAAGETCLLQKETDVRLKQTEGERKETPNNLSVQGDRTAEEFLRDVQFMRAEACAQRLAGAVCRLQDEQAKAEAAQKFKRAGELRKQIIALQANFSATALAEGFRDDEYFVLIEKRAR